VKRSVASKLLAPLVALCLVASAAGAEDLGQRLAKGSRSDADKARDAGRKPADVISFLGIEPGMTVVDVIAAGGWYTEVLAEAVGPDGKVYAHNTAFTLQFREGANDKAMNARLEKARLPNVERLDREIADLGLTPGTIDAAITALNFHDIYNGYGSDTASGFLAAIYDILKPGGVFGIIDHVGRPGFDNEKLHRIDPKTVEQLARAAGFIVEGRSKLLANPRDDHATNVFDAAIRGKTDRFLLKLRKPKQP